MRAFAARLGLILLFLAAALLAWALVPAWTPAAPSRYGIAELRTVYLNGEPQSVLIRGEDRRAPVLLFLHGGPGAAVSMIAPSQWADLERAFVVVHWDQPGAGRSCAVDGPRSLARIEADALALIELLREEFQERRIVLVGASWGSIPGIRLAARYPHLVAAYAGDGQVVNTRRAFELGRAFAQESASKAGDAGQAAEMGALVGQAADPAAVGAVRGALWSAGGVVNDPRALLAAAWPALWRPEYTLVDRLRYLPCLAESAAALYPEVLEIAFDQDQPQLRVPTWFIAGEGDYLTPLALAEELASRTGATLVRVPETGHVSALERPARFQEVLLRDVLPVALASRDEPALDLRPEDVGCVEPLR